MSSPAAPIDDDRRAALIATGVAGAVGAVAAATPFVASFAPSERARAAGAPVEFDLSTLAPGEMKTVEWRGKPVWILRRTPDMLEAIKKVSDQVADPASQRTAYPTPPYARNEYRSIKPEYLIVVGICTHLGCSPVGPFAAGTNPQLGADPGFLCPCHGSTFDLAGRVFKNKPAPDNLEVPPHKYLSDTVVLIGDDSQA
ncbi:MAG: ubiquinol-cytochrome c reductase iron-sulfur subunit [Sutterellaceae bacterium]|nr:ubiquinol-cytochrome c reductase iron-sulfur subunit [Burkholderiaceae bacterium]MDW8430582.1 ubiquinol-cytochrome c reductase iron-sulfur subunit [Sutterellaceae bacterium]